VRRAVDTNVLVYAHVTSLPEHDRAHRFLEEELGRGVTLVITPSVLHEWIHVVTDARRFEPPVPMSEALGVARGYLNRTNVECLATDGSATALALDLLQRHQLGRRRLADTLFAATLLHHGVHEIITHNPRDFAVFEGLHPIDPVASP